ncbi:MAG: flagellar hook-basal body protein [bacterium]
MTTAAEAAAQAMVMLDQITQIIAHNVANANTTGFKQTLAEVSGGDPTQIFRAAGGGAVPLGTLPGLPAGLHTVVDPRPGSINPTGNPLDVALDGPGFITVLTPNGTAYTRNGHFHLDGTGQIVTDSGAAVAGANGPIVVPSGAAAVAVSPDGTVSADGSAIGQLQIVSAADPRSATSMGDGLYQIAGTPGAGTARIVPGALEGSNVSVIQEMTHLITTLRAYGGAQQVMQVEDSTQNLGAQSVGQVS